MTGRRPCSERPPTSRLEEGHHKMVELLSKVRQKVDG
jgi:hypothetical protein